MQSFWAGFFDGAPSTGTLEKKKYIMHYNHSEARTVTLPDWEKCIPSGAILLYYSGYHTLGE